MTLEVLYVDNHLLAVAKPAGVAVVPDSSGDESLLERSKAWCKHEFSKPGEVFLGVVHRLDRPVSGVVLFARTSKAASRLSEQFRSHTVRKLYWAVSEARPRERAGRVEHALVKDEARNVVAPVDARRPGAQLAVTEWRVVDAPGPYTQFDLMPHTGRPHQLRVALASLGCPILGDLKYGAAAPLDDRSIALHAAELEFEHPTLRERRALRCAAPEREWWRTRHRLG
ncbi:MAG: RNA pseudouridine synthase [Planctomycetes bacterium]|nr:RNA pseudouridine synthase [Planctomycetota bacterium]